MTKILTFSSIGLATVALALGYILGDQWAWAIPAVILGALWALGQWRGWSWTSAWGLILLVVLAAVGLLLDVAAGWMLLSVVAALSAWDMEHLGRQLLEADPQEAGQLERQHLLRLLFVDVLGLLLAGAALTIKTRVSFGMALLLGFAVILALSRTVGFLRRESD